MSTLPVIGGGVLGDLNYSERQKGWALELGVWITNFIVVFHPGTPITNKDESREPVIRSLTEIFESHRIRMTVAELMAASQDDVSKASSIVREEIQRSEGDDICALFLIGQCIRGRDVLTVDGTAVLESILNDHIADLQHYCASLHMSLDAFRAVLSSLQGDDLRVGRVSALLTKLAQPLRTLLLSSNPIDIQTLRLGEERRELEETLQLARFRNALKVEEVPSCRTRDITRALDRVKPNILHFSGHGNSQALCFEDDRGNARPVDAVALANLLATQENLQLVILNACYSSDQGQAIADAVGYCIGMEGAIMDDDAISFTREFYGALADGRTVPSAFERARLAVALTSTMRPHLLQRQTRLVIASP